MRKFVVFLSFYLLVLSCLNAQEIDEQKLFSDEQTVVEEKEVIDLTLGQETEKESVSFSGEIMNRSLYLMHRDWLKGKGKFGENMILTDNEADIFLDIRLKKQVKAFINLSIVNMPSHLTTTSNILDDAVKEFFIDANIDRKVYFRMGKQVLQWGRTYFWHPTDLINIDRLDFFDMARYRRGVYGLKVHMPFGSTKNFYMFTDFGDAENIDGLAIAGKFEFLVGGTEYAVSAWKKKGYGPAYGFDFSTNLFAVDVAGEVSLIYERDKQQVRINNATAFLANKADAWQTMASLSMAKTFDWELNDRISLVAEVFYNGSGYDTGVFTSQAKDLLFDNNLYEANYHGKYYAAIFASVSKFPITDMNVHANTLNNLSDGSYVLITGLGFEPVNHLSFNFNLNWFGGPPDAEYTYFGYGLAFDVFTTLVF
ncbi:hypothetical protein ACFLZV_02165 [Candidatus Margulisiibacteriota bacterium]